MKSFLSACVLAFVTAQTYGEITYNSDGSINLPNKMAADSGGVTYNSDGGLDMPYHIHAGDSSGLDMPYHIHAGDSGGLDMPYHINHDSDTRQGAITYNSDGSINLPNHLAQAANSGGGVTYTSDGGIVLPNHLAQEAHGGVTYNSEGGIVLPNSMASGNQTSGGGGYMDMPYHISGSSGDSVHHGLTYDSEGNIVLPNSMAQQGSEYHQGKGTFYDAASHVAACGKTHDNTELVVALSAKRMGNDKSSNNENCGKKVVISGPSGQQVEAEVVDFCMTCDENGLDMTPAVFEKLSDFSNQDVPIKWKFMS